MTRTFLLLLSILPGAGAILLGHGSFGSLLMILGLFGWDAMALGFLLLGEQAQTIGWAGAVIGPTATVISVVWTAIMTSPTRRDRQRALAERALETAYLAYLRDNLRGAWIAVEKGLRGAQDDADLLFLAWCLTLRSHRRRGLERRLYRRLLRADEDGKWSWEIERELEAQAK
ncbi:MAG: hypothetical protein AAF581_23765 [Planctomycetota bacterium]